MFYVSRNCGINRAVGRLEAGLDNPTMTTLIKLAEALDVDLNTLIPLK